MSKNKTLVPISALHAFSRNLWDLASKLVPFRMFSNDVDIQEKEKMATMFLQCEPVMRLQS